MCVHIFFVSSLSFLCPSFTGFVCVLDFFTVTIFWVFFFVASSYSSCKRIRFWRVTSKVLREMSLTTNFFSPFTFFFPLVVPFGKHSTAKDSTWKKSTIKYFVKKMYRMISQAWTCNLMDFSFFFLRLTSPSKKPHCP